MATRVFTKDHRFRIKGQTSKAERVIVVGSGRTTYVWVGMEDGECLAHFCGPKTLRAIAKEILRRLPLEAS